MNSTRRFFTMPSGPRRLATTPPLGNRRPLTQVKRYGFEVRTPPSSQWNRQENIKKNKKQGPPKVEKLRFFFFSISWVRAAQNGPRVNNGPITAAERVRKKNKFPEHFYNTTLVIHQMNNIKERETADIKRERKSYAIRMIRFCFSRPHEASWRHWHTHTHTHNF
jgi:hypothetical protein